MRSLVMLLYATLFYVSGLAHKLLLFADDVAPLLTSKGGLQESQNMFVEIEK